LSASAGRWAQASHSFVQQRDTTHLLVEPQTIVLLEEFLVVRDVVFAKDEAEIVGISWTVEASIGVEPDVREACIKPRFKKLVAQERTRPS
jgi:hypothetical protein